MVNLEGNLSAVSLGQDGGSVTSSPVGQPACGFCPNYTDSTSSQIYNRAPDIKVQHSLVLLPFCVYCSGLGGVQIFQPMRKLQENFVNIQERGYMFYLIGGSGPTVV